MLKVIKLCSVGLFTGNLMYSRPLHTATRQSSRHRVAPLRFWVNERIVLTPLSATPRIVSSHSPDISNITDEVWSAVVRCISSSKITFIIAHCTFVEWGRLQPMWISVQLSCINFDRF